MSAGAHRPVSVDGGTKWEGLSPLRRKADVSSRHECRRLQRIGTQTGGSKAIPIFGFAAATADAARRREASPPDPKSAAAAHRAESRRPSGSFRTPAPCMRRRVAPLQAGRAAALAAVSHGAHRSDRKLRRTRRQRMMHARGTVGAGSFLRGARRTTWNSGMRCLCTMRTGACRVGSAQERRRGSLALERSTPAQ
jgi:hypothetical protein